MEKLHLSEFTTFVRQGEIIGICLTHTYTHTQLEIESATENIEAGTTHKPKNTIIFIYTLPNVDSQLYAALISRNPETII